jgi:hypothetical protein
MPKRLTREEFILKAKNIHGEKYDYKDVVYLKSCLKVIIICKEHGKFEQKPNVHLNGSGCKLCYHNNLTFSKEEFVSRANKIHGIGKYDYSESNYVRSIDFITIKCPVENHGYFNQIANSHLRGKGCSKCGGCGSYDKNYFIIKAEKIHGKKYDYSKVLYDNSYTEIIIICKKQNHGEFKQRPDCHLLGSGCIKCQYDKKRSNTEEFIIKAKKLHENKYDYSKVDYNSSNVKISIICVENNHGVFNQTPNGHLRGRGCPKCISNAYSKVQIQWLELLSNLYNINIQHALNGGEYIIEKTRWKADGYCAETNTIFEYHGSFWHGDPVLYKSEMMNPVLKKTMGDVYNNTIIREQKIKELGYNLVVMWESEWLKINKSVKYIQRLFRLKTIS